MLRFQNRKQLCFGSEAIHRFKKMAILKTACVFSLCFLVGLGMFSYTRTPFTVETEYKVRVLFGLLD